MARARLTSGRWTTARAAAASVAIALSAQARGAAGPTAVDAVGTHFELLGDVDGDGRVLREIQDERPEFGATVCGGIDHDRDGAPDVVVGAPDDDLGRGAIVVVSGRTGEKFFWMRGREDDDRFGERVRVAQRTGSAPTVAVAMRPWSPYEPGAIRVHAWARPPVLWYEIDRQSLTGSSAADR